MNNQLRNSDRNTPFFTDEGRVLLAKVVHVYDADTVHCVVEKDGCLGKMNVRLNGIDTPEMRPPKAQENRDQEKMAARMARNKVVELVTGVSVNPMEKDINHIVDQHQQLIYLVCFGEDKYGRTLGSLHCMGADADGVDGDGIHYDSESINDILLREGYAGVYEGGTKQPFTSYFKHMDLLN